MTLATVTIDFGVLSPEITMGAGDTVFNSGLIVGLVTGVTIGAGGSVNNFGDIIGATTDGILLGAGGIVTNTGAVKGANFGVNDGADGVVFNSGTISGTLMDGVIVGAGGKVTNTEDGFIDGNVMGITGGANALIENAGNVIGSTGSGIFLGETSTVKNSVLGTISGGAAGITGGATVTLENAGSITSADGSGISLGAGGVVINFDTGRVSGATFGMVGGATIYLENIGSIIGLSKDGLALGATSTVVNYIDAAIVGAVSGVTADAGSTVVNYGSITGDTAIGVDMSLGGTVYNGGLISGATVAVQFGGAGANDLILGSGAKFEGLCVGSLAAGATNTLSLGAGTGTLTDFGVRFLHFQTIAVGEDAHWVISGAEPVETVTITVAEGSGVVYNGVLFGSPAPPCYCAGTMIRGVDGEIAVEDIVVGDRVPGLVGGADLQVRWIGHRRVRTRGHSRPWDVQPVRISAHAFGPGRPYRDLRLSPDHAVHIEGRDGTAGVLVPVRYLINGATIVQETVETVTYYHVELADDAGTPVHDVIMAQGLPAESYLDTGNRNAFADAGQTVALHADFARAVWQDASCAPLVLEGPGLAVIRESLHARALARGHVLTTAPDLHLLVDGVALLPRPTASGWRFQLPPGALDIRLVSRASSPADVGPDSLDRRVLGVAVRGLVLDGAAIALDDPRLTTGWHASESGWRWTNGAASMRCGGGRVLDIDIAPIAATYWWSGIDAAARQRAA